MIHIFNIFINILRVQNCTPANGATRASVAVWPRQRPSAPACGPDLLLLLLVFFLQFCVFVCVCSFVNNIIPDNYDSFEIHISKQHIPGPITPDGKRTQNFTGIHRHFLSFSPEYRIRTLSKS